MSPVVVRGHGGQLQPFSRKNRISAAAAIFFIIIFFAPQLLEIIIRCDWSEQIWVREERRNGRCEWGRNMGIRTRSQIRGSLRGPPPLLPLLPSSPSLTPADLRCSFGVGGCEVDYIFPEKQTLFLSLILLLSPHLPVLTFLPFLSATPRPPHTGAPVFFSSVPTEPSFTH